MGETAIEWSSHPARARPAVAVAALLCVAAIGVLIAQLTAEWLWGALSMVGLFLSLSRFFLPTRFRVTPERVEAAHALAASSMALTDVQCIYWRESRALISRGDTARARARGIALDFAGLDPARRDAVRDFISPRVPEGAWR